MLQISKGIRSGTANLGTSAVFYFDKEIGRLGQQKDKKSISCFNYGVAYYHLDYTGMSR
jgi:hypothetical protein